MTNDQQKDIQPQKLVLDTPFDNTTGLYIGRISDVPGTITTDSGQQDARFDGEVLLYGRIEGPSIIVDRLRRVALYASLVDPEADSRINVLSMAGPQKDVVLQPGPAGAIQDILLTLHYDELTERLQPLYASSDALYPQVEQIAMRLVWEQDGPVDPITPRIRIRLATTGLATSLLGTVQAIQVNELTVNFRLAGSEPPRGEPMNTLGSNCPPQPPLPCDPNLVTVARYVPVRFINFSNKSVQDIDRICRDQIAGVCEVWRNKAALDLVIEPSVNEVIDGTPNNKARFATLDPLEEDQVRVYYGNWRHLEIYLIEQFSGGGGGGGKAYNCGQAAAYIVLEADAADTNPYLLAHELGHVLGLGHPGEPGLTYLGSLGSIMVPARPNPNINTLSNCQIFTAGAQQQPLNPIVASTAAPDCFRPNAP